MLYHTPDKHWEIWGCTNYDCYLEKYLVKGNFHDKVPEEIIDASATIEYLIAHAYYYFKIYDEALNKALRIVELSVKLRCKQLGIDLQHEEVDLNSKKRNKDFSRLNEDLIKKEKNKELTYVLNYIRFMRNNQMHPTMNSFVGGRNNGVIIKCFETVNLLFAEGEDITVWNERVKKPF
jgi:hypothetical protein